VGVSGRLVLGVGTLVCSGTTLQDSGGGMCMHQGAISAVGAATAEIALNPHIAACVPQWWRLRLRQPPGALKGSQIISLGIFFIAALLYRTSASPLQSQLQPALTASQP
jgi:hypothetical protein